MTGLAQNWNAEIYSETIHCSQKLSEQYEMKQRQKKCLFINGPAELLWDQLLHWVFWGLRYMFSAGSSSSNVLVMPEKLITGLLLMVTKLRCMGRYSVARGLINANSKVARLMTLFSMDMMNSKMHIVSVSTSGWTSPPRLRDYSILTFECVTSWMKTTMGKFQEKLWIS